MEATEKEAEGVYGGKEKPVITTQSTAHDTVRHNKTKNDEKRAQFFFRVQWRLQKGGMFVVLSKWRPWGEHKTKAAFASNKSKLPACE
jgi:hypothetical protein